MLFRAVKDLFSTNINTPTKPCDDHIQIPLEHGNSLVQTRHGWFIANEHDLFLGMSFVLYGECIETEFRFLESLLAPGDNVIEVGANIGALTIPIAKKIGPAGSLIAIDPQPAVFLTLCANIALNSLTNVKPHAIGCGASKSVMYLPETNYTTEATHNSGGISLLTDPSNEAHHRVNVIPLDDIATEITRLKLIKIDAEGMELEILKGATQLIQTFRPLLFVENDRTEKSESLIKWLHGAGYRLWWSITPLFNPDNFFENPENKYDKIASFNMLCVPKEKPSEATNGLIEITDPTDHPFYHHGRPR